MKQIVVSFFRGPLDGLTVKLSAGSLKLNGTLVSNPGIVPDRRPVYSVFTLSARTAKVRFVGWHTSDGVFHAIVTPLNRHVLAANADGK